MAEMREIRVVMSEGAFKACRRALGLKVLMGNAYGVLDSLAQRVLVGIEDGDEDVILELPEEE